MGTLNFLFFRNLLINKMVILRYLEKIKNFCAGVRPREQCFTGETFKSCAFYLIYNVSQVKKKLCLMKHCTSNKKHNF